MKVYSYPYTAVLSFPLPRGFTGDAQESGYLTRVIGEQTACCRATARRIIPGRVLAALSQGRPALAYVESIGKGQFHRHA